MIEPPAELDDEIKKDLMSDELTTPIEIHGRKYYPDEVAASGSTAVVWKGRDELGSPIAIKFTVAKEYERRPLLQEIALAAKLRGYPRFAQFIDATIIERPSSKGPRKFVCFIEEWIDGPTLRKYLQEEESISCSFLVEYVRMMCEALNNLNFNGLCHDDLHPGNIKIAPPKPGSLTIHEADVKIIDTGSLRRAPSEKEIDDHRRFVQHVVDIRNAIHRRKKLSLADMRFLDEVIPLLNRMLEEETTVALTDPSKIAEEFASTWKQCNYPGEESEQKLDDPFHYISAETISSDKLLVNLFAESCPWKNDVLSPDPLVLTGPRGCGKSTVFRRLSLKGMLFKGVEEIKNSKIAGFYISCSTDLRNHLNWINNENLVRRFRGEVKHYFNLIVTREIVNTFNIIRSREDRETVFGFTSDEEMRLHNFIIDKLTVPKDIQLHLQGVPPMAHALDVIETEMEKCYESMIRGLTIIEDKTQQSYVSNLTTFLNENVSYLGDKKIVFFIDDLSTRQIPKEIQTVFNDIILERAKNHVFKISSDKYGWSGLDSLSATGEKYREFREIDCGRFYLVDADSSLKRKFTRELLAKRLELSGYRGKPEEIIGTSEFAEGSLGKTIRKKSQSGERPNDVYYGLETITELCCGDISVLLEIYRRIFKKGKVDQNSHELVPPHVQHDAIESVSRELYDHIKNYVPHGNEMYAIVTHFGTLSRRILQEGKPHHQESRTIYPETTRIEVDEDPTQPNLGFPSNLIELMRELIKRAIFIELEPGRSRHGFTPSLRWQLRPVLCPTFLTTPSKNIAIKWTPEDFKYFLIAPEEKCSIEFEKWKTPETKPGKKLTDFPA